jgi:hypothetical protein
MQYSFDITRATQQGLPNYRDVVRLATAWHDGPVQRFVLRHARHNAGYVSVGSSNQTIKNGLQFRLGCDIERELTGTPNQSQPWAESAAHRRHLLSWVLFHVKQQRWVVFHRRNKAKARTNNNQQRYNDTCKHKYNARTYRVQKCAFHGPPRMAYNTCSRHM